MLRLALDATALLDARTGVGAFTAAVLERMAPRSDLVVSAYAVTWRNRGRLAARLPDGVRAVGTPMPAGLLRAGWVRCDLPPIEWFTGSVDVVHGTNFVVPPARRAARVVTVHDLTPWRFPELAIAATRSYPDLVARAARTGAWVHAVSDFVADEVRDVIAIDPERVVAIANGAPALGPVTPTTGAGSGRMLAGGDRYVLALGTVEPRKDLPALVVAFDALAAGDPGLRLVLAGQDGWGAEALATTIDVAHHRNRIVRLGWVSDDDRAALIRGATVFAYPSHYEGFGLPPLEAMAAGTAVVTTTAGALPEVVGDAAVLVPPGDSDALAGAIGSLLADDALRARLVAAGHRRRASFSWDRCTDDLVALYHRAASG